MSKLYSSLNNLNNPKKEAVLFLTCWIIYFAAYAGRLNYSAAMVQMISGGVISKTGAGTASSIFFFAYGFGQIITGYAGDRISPFKMISCGLFLSAFCNICMTFTGGNVSAMCVIWGMNGLVQSALWSPIVRIFAQVLSPERRLKAAVHINSTVPAGTVFTYLLSTFLLSRSGYSVYSGWKSVFYSGGIILAAAAVIWTVYCASNRKNFILNISTISNISAIQEKNEKTEKTEKNEKIEKIETPPVFFGNIAVILLIFALPAVIHGMLKDSVTTWFPVYLTENYDTPPYMSVLITTLLPVLNLFGIYFAKWIYVKLRENELSACAVMFAVCAAGFACMFLFGRYSLYLSAVFAAAGTASITGVNGILVSILPMRFGNTGRTSAVAGALNSLTYLGCSVSMAGFGKIVDVGGWTSVISTWFAVASAGIILCIVLTKFRKKYIKN